MAAVRRRRHRRTVTSGDLKEPIQDFALLQCDEGRHGGIVVTGTRPIDPRTPSSLNAMKLSDGNWLLQSDRMIVATGDEPMTDRGIIAVNAVGRGVQMRDILITLYEQVFARTLG